MNSRRLAWIVALFVGGVVLLSLYVQNKEAQRTATKPPASQPATAPASAPAVTPPASAPAASAPVKAAAIAAQTQAAQPASPSAVIEAPGAAAAPAAPNVVGGLDTSELAYAPAAPAKYVLGSMADKSPYKFQVEITNEGAGIRVLQLTDYFETVQDRRAHDKDPVGYAKLVETEPGKYKGHYRLLNTVPAPDGGYYIPYATRRLSITLPGQNRSVPVPLDSKFWTADEGVIGDGKGTQTLRMSCTLYRDPSHGGDPQAAKPFVRLVKTYRVVPNSYSLGIDIEAENFSGQPLSLAIDQAGATGIPRDPASADMRQAAFGRLQEGRVQPTLKPAKSLNDLAMGKEDPVGKTIEDPGGKFSSTLWLGVVDRYFGSMMYLKPADPNALAPTDQGTFYIEPVAEHDVRTFLAGLEIRQTLAGGARQTFSLDVFAGPKQRSLLADNPLYSKLDYLGTIDLGSCFCASSQLTFGMMWLLEKLAIVSLGNMGIAIILLVVLVRLVLHPLTKKGQVSMMKMQKLGPAMAKLKEKYADDKESLNREMVQLYKQAGATPILGCLPMVLQMPIWIALWTALQNAVELRQAAFLPFWLTDLSAPDALFAFPAALPLLGSYFNLLPILVAVSMYLQTKLNPPMTAAATPQAAQQQKMMNIMMPGMMLVIFWSTPSGLSLYVMASTFAGVVEQYVIRKHIKDRQAREAASEMTVSIPGGGLRGGKAKKPKGPFFFKR